MSRIMTHRPPSRITAAVCTAIASLAGSLLMSAPSLADQSGVPTPVVTTANGKLQGTSTQHDKLDIFRGIPYAAPPVGPLRWRAPQPAKPWKGVREATHFGAACVQKVARQEPEKSLKDYPQSEDCLTLNVWRPANVPANKPLPVMVWVHGGSFRFGAGSLGVYDGAELAKRGVIVVTLNYRLGLFGTFAYPGLAPAGEPTGNFGLLDVIQALKWVNGNISAFGGDPHKVTLFGESAGGVSVAYLMTSPLAKGLFQQAIVESGGLAIPEFDPKTAEKVAHRVAGDLKAKSPADLRKLSAEAIRDANTAPAETMPFIDGTILPSKLRDAFTTGKAAAMPLIIGSNSAEAGFFGPRYWKGFPDDMGKDNWAKLKPTCFDYGTQSDDACAEQAASEFFAGLTTRAMERGASKNAPVYAYRFGWVPPEKRDSVRGAIHTSEIAYVYGHVAADPKADEASRKLSDDLANRWVAFAKTGVPDAGKKPDWPRFKAGTAEMLLNVSNTGEATSANPANAMLDTLDAMHLPARP